MGKRLSQLNSVNTTNPEDYLLLDNNNFYESKKIQLKDINLKNFDTSEFYDRAAANQTFIQKGEILPSLEVDQTYNPDSINAQSGKAVAAAINNISVSSNNKYIFLDTNKKQYSSNYFARMVDERWDMRWSNVKNAGDCNVGDIGILRGYNTTTNADVMLICDITGVGSDYVDTIPKVCIQGPEGELGYRPLAKSHSFENQTVAFELKKGYMYSFSVHDSDTNSVRIITNDGATIRGINGADLEGLKTGIIICADKCTVAGLTDNFSLLNLNSLFISDRWNWNYNGQYLQTTDNSGIDIWEL